MADYVYMMKTNTEIMSLYIVFRDMEYGNRGVLDVATIDAVYLGDKAQAIVHANFANRMDREDPMGPGEPFKITAIPVPAGNLEPSKRGVSIVREDRRAEVDAMPLDAQLEPLLSYLDPTSRQYAELIRRTTGR